MKMSSMPLQPNFLALCGSLLLTLHFQPLAADDWPQWRGPQRDGIWRESGIVNTFSSDQLPHKWSAEIGSGYSGPTVADGRVFVTDRGLDGDASQQERVLCFDDATGRRLWEHAYDARYTISYTAGPRAAVTIDQQRAYAVGAMGHFHCLDVRTGDVIWKRDLEQEYSIAMPIWGIAAAPLIYRDSVIQQVGGTPDACIVAFDKRTGEERWRALPDRAGYSSPVLIEQGEQQVLVCWTGDSVSGLNPNNGKVYWSVPFPPTQMPIGIVTPVTDGERLYVSSFYDGSLMLQLDQEEPKATVLWKKAGRDEKNTVSLHVMIGTPILEDGYVYGVDSYGQLRCLDADTGDRVWEDTTAVPTARWATIHMVRHDEDVWMFNDQGELLIGNLSPEGFEEKSRTKLIEQTTGQLSRRGGVTWAHPAFANRHVFARNDKELVCASLGTVQK